MVNDKCTHLTSVIERWIIVDVCKVREPISLYPINTRESAKQMNPSMGGRAIHTTFLSYLMQNIQSRSQLFIKFMKNNQHKQFKQFEHTIPSQQIFNMQVSYS